MNDGTHRTAGIDVGTSSVKVAIARSNAGDDGVMEALVHQRIRRRNVGDVISASFQEACSAAHCGLDDLDYVCTTGDAESLEFATGHFYGMTTHARGAIFLIPEARAVLDLGALHSRAIAMDGRGKVTNHRMTSQCASGTGQFLESIARYLGVPLEDVGMLSQASKAVEETSSICSVLAETDVINLVARGAPTGDILKGIHVSIARRLSQLLRAIGARGIVALTGGLAHDAGMLGALNDVLASDSKVKRPGAQRIEVKTHPDAIYAGAIGAALLGAFRHEQRRGRAHASATTDVDEGNRSVEY
ncbi:MAG: benzoyl-CoA reductase subunit D [Polyangiaceae bacterium]|nr:benzoyl-CoA reductase subunit D [Polyangiaceae bacterium]